MLTRLTQGRENTVIKAGKRKSSVTTSFFNNSKDASQAQPWVKVHLVFLF